MSRKIVANHLILFGESLLWGVERRFENFSGDLVNLQKSLLNPYYVESAAHSQNYP
jgi:hypothetical protein